MKQTLICIIGTDGSGKTTLAEAVVSSLAARGVTARLEWLGAQSYVMAPVRGLLKLVWGRRRGSTAGSPKLGAASQRVDYAKEIARKNALAAKYAWAVKLYLALIWLDYRLQLMLKRWHSGDADMVIADRYLFDVVVNIGLTLGWSPDRVVAFAQSWLARLPLPDVKVFLRVAPEVSLQRKTDIYDIDYLRLRFSYYEAIAQAFGFDIRDGTLPIATNRDWLLAQIEAETNRPLVLYVHANNADIGGADKVLAMMAEHMRDYGGARVAVVLRLQTAITRTYAKAGITVVHHPFLRPQVSKGLLGLTRFALMAPASLWFFWRLFRREQPDIVHVNDLYDLLPALAARACGIPTVWHVRMIPASKRLRQAFALLLDRVPSQVIFISQAVAAAFPRVTRNRCDVIYDFADTDLSIGKSFGIAPTPPPAPLPQGPRLVTMVGRVEPWKGQHVFLEAIAALPQTLRAGTTFALVGGSVPGKEAYFTDTSNKARALGVWVLGSRSDVPRVLRATDIAVHCSVTPEPLGAVVLESMLAGAATVATAHGGVPEIILNETQGVLVPPDDAPALTAALTALLNHPQPPRQRFANAGRRRALALTDRDTIAGQIQMTYQRLIHADAANL